MILVLDITKIR